MDDGIEREASGRASKDAFLYALCFLFINCVLDLATHWGDASFDSTTALIYLILFLYWWVKKRLYMKEFMKDSGEKVPLTVFDAAELALAIIPPVVCFSLELFWTLG